MDYQSYLSHNVAVNLKRIRTSKSMSLDVLSEQTGVSKSMLAQIEKGTANPSLGVLGKITSGLRIEFQELIEAPPMESCLVTLDQMTPTKEMIGEYKVWTCFPYEDNHQLEIYRIDIEPGGEYVSGSHGEKTREYISVTDGELTIECNGEIQKISKEQIYRFETSKNLLQKAQASGFINMVVFAAIIPALANISISDLIDLILPLVVVFAVSVLSIFVMMKVLPVWKILGDKSMAFGVGFCQMLGFPSTYLISVEVCNAVAEDEDEKAFLMSRVMPRLVVGGMAAMVSILVAGVMAGML